MPSETKAALKAALASIWALTYKATHVPNLDLMQISELTDALNTISSGLEGDAYFNKWAQHICGCLRTSGIISIPSRRPKGTEEILADCDRLQRHLSSRP